MSEGGRAKKALCCGSLATSADAPLKRPASRAKPRLQLFPLRSIRIVAVTGFAAEIVLKSQFAFERDHHRYRPGKVGDSASSCAKHQHPHTSSSRNVALLFPQPDISAWWPGPAWRQNSPFPFIPTCCGTPAGSSSPTTATTRAPSRPTSATDRSCPRFAILR